jgi:hypothetical protein
LKALRLETGLSIRQLARLMAMPFTTYASFEQRYEQRPLPEEFVDRVGAVFKMLGLSKAKVGALKTGLLEKKAPSDARLTARPAEKRGVREEFEEVVLQITLSAIRKRPGSSCFTDKKTIDHALNSVETLGHSARHEVVLDPVAGAGTFLLAAVRDEKSNAALQRLVESLEDTRVLNDAAARRLAKFIEGFSFSNDPTKKRLTLSVRPLPRRARGPAVA